MTKERTIRSQLIKKKRRWVILLLTLHLEVVSPLQLLMYSGHEQKLQIKILLDVSIQGEYLMLFFGPIILLVESNKIPLKRQLAD